MKIILVFLMAASAQAERGRTTHVNRAGGHQTKAGLDTPARGEKFVAFKWQGDPGEGIRNGSLIDPLPPNSSPSRNPCPKSPLVTDVFSHMKYPASLYPDNDENGHPNPYDTRVHENIHAINSNTRFIRKYVPAPNTTKHYFQGLYLFRNELISVDIPLITRKQILGFVPSSFPGQQYRFYLNTRSDEELYLVDEWNSYTAGAEASVEMATLRTGCSQSHDALTGMMAMMPVAIATAMASEKYDNTRFHAKPKLMEYLAYNIERVMKIYKEGKALGIYSTTREENFLGHLLYGNDGSAMREFLFKHMGADWTKRVLGIAPPADLATTEPKEKKVLE